MPGVRTHARDSHHTIGAEGGDHVVGPSVVQGLRVQGECRPHPLGDLGKRCPAHCAILTRPSYSLRRFDRHRIHSKSQIHHGPLEGVHVDGAQGGGELVVGEAGQEAVEGALEVGDAALDAL